MNLLLPEIMNFQKSLKDQKEKGSVSDLKDAGMKLAFLKKKYNIKNFSFLVNLFQANFFFSKNK